MIQKALRGRYWRFWTCSNGHQSIRCSCEDLAEPGVPVCTDCDREMELQ